MRDERGQRKITKIKAKDGLRLDGAATSAAGQRPACRQAGTKVKKIKKVFYKNKGNIGKEYAIRS